MFAASRITNNGCNMRPTYKSNHCPIETLHRVGKLSARLVEVAAGWGRGNRVTSRNNDRHLNITHNLRHKNMSKLRIQALIN